MRNKNKINDEDLKKILSFRPRIEKVAIKDACTKNFQTEDVNRDELVKQIYDITYGSLKKTDNLVIVDENLPKWNHFAEKYFKNVKQTFTKENCCSFKCASN